MRRPSLKGALYVFTVGGPWSVIITERDEREPGMIIFRGHIYHEDQAMHNCGVAFPKEVIEDAKTPLHTLLDMSARMIVERFRTHRDSSEPSA